MLLLSLASRRCNCQENSSAWHLWSKTKPQKEFPNYNQIFPSDLQVAKPEAHCSATHGAGQLEWERYKPDLL